MMTKMYVTSENKKINGEKKICLGLLNTKTWHLVHELPDSQLTGSWEMMKRKVSLHSRLIYLHC